MSENIIKFCPKCWIKGVKAEARFYEPLDLYECYTCGWYGPIDEAR